MLCYRISITISPILATEYYLTSSFQPNLYPGITLPYSGLVLILQFSLKLDNYIIYKHLGEIISKKYIIICLKVFSSGY